MPVVRIMTLNVLNGALGREGLIRQVVQRIRPDVAVFTEARLTSEFIAAASDAGSHRAHGDVDRTQGCILIVSRWPIAASDQFGPGRSASRWVRATVRPFEGPPLIVVGVHLTPHLLWPFELVRVREVHHLIRHLGDGCQIVGGDFNTLSVGDNHKLSRSAWWVRGQWLLQAGWMPRWSLRRMNAAGYEDCYRACHRSADGFTVPACDPRVRIDYLFASRELAPSLLAAGTQEASPASDHLAVWADFEWPGSDTAVR